MAAELSARVGGHFEEDGYSFVVPSVMIALWRQLDDSRNAELDDEDEDEDLPRHWSSVPVARPGYYDSEAPL